MSSQFRHDEKILDSLQKNIREKEEERNKIKELYAIYVEIEDNYTHRKEERIFNDIESAIEYIEEELKNSFFTVNSTIKYIYRG